MWKQMVNKVRQEFFVRFWAISVLFGFVVFHSSFRRKLFSFHRFLIAFLEPAPVCDWCR